MTETVSVPVEESISVPDSDPTMVETPSEPTETVTPTEPTEPIAPVEPEAELFELPDGRKVDGVTLTKEWKENFLPDYTKKSQTLAEIEKSKLPATEPAKVPHADPNWVPQSYAELIDIAKQEMKGDLIKEEQQRIADNQAIETEVVNQLADVKKLDKDVNENALFLHATKYGFRDLRLAHQNMKDMSEAMKKVQTTTAANIAKRNDPVSISPGATGTRPDPSQFENARDYLRSLK